jgi:hypothetical protein
VSAFEMSVNVGDYGFAMPDPEVIKAGGAPSRIDVILKVVQVLGVPGGQMAAVPLGDLKFGLGRDDAIKFAETMKEQAELLPPESKIAVATDLRQAEQMGQDFEAFRNGHQSS